MRKKIIWKVCFLTHLAFFSNLTMSCGDDGDTPQPKEVPKEEPKEEVKLSIYEKEVRDIKWVSAVYHQNISHILLYSIQWDDYSSSAYPCYLCEISCGIPNSSYQELNTRGYGVKLYKLKTGVDYEWSLTLPTNLWNDNECYAKVEWLGEKSYKITISMKQLQDKFGGIITDYKATWTGSIDIVNMLEY